MDNTLSFSSLTTNQWIVLAAGAMLIGMAKAGVKGMGIFVVPLMAAVFGGKASTGLVLPMLSLADIFAVSYYNRHAEWKYVLRLLPAALLGLGVGIWVGNVVSDAVFDDLIAWIIIGSLVLMIGQELRKLPDLLVGSWGFGSFFGLLGGFTTMIGNAAGPVLAVYLLSVRLPKNQFIGTAAWFFMIINLAKFPFHIWVWETITWESFQLNLVILPAIALGIFIGVRIVRYIPERGFRYLVLIMTAIISLRLLLA